MSRELISASLDAEVSTLERQAMDAHVARCSSCGTFRSALIALDRDQALVRRSEAPDLTESILARHAADQQSAESAGSRLIRLALFAVGTVQLLLSLDQLLHESPVTGHLARDLGAWDLAFAVGLLVCALQPWRARGVLPMVAALLVVITITIVFDVGRDAVGVVSELPHLAEYAGVLLLWLLARSWSGGAGRSDRPAGGGSSPGSESARSLEPVRG